MSDLKIKYRRISAVLGFLVFLMGCVIMLMMMYKSRSALGIPMGSVSLEGLRMQFFAWLAICLISVPLAFYLSRVSLYGVFGLVMLFAGKFSSEEAKQFLWHGSYPVSWFESFTRETFTAVQPPESGSSHGKINETLISGLISDDEEAIAAFGECDNCVVIDWRDDAEDIFTAAMPFLPHGYLHVEEHGDTEWKIQAGTRPARIVEFTERTKQEDILVTLNHVLAPDFELWQYTPVNGDGYSLFLAPSAWWQSFATEHPGVLAKYFLSLDRLAAHWKKGFLARLFSKP